MCGSGVQGHCLSNDLAENSLPSEYIDERLKGKLKMESLNLGAEDTSEPCEEYVRQQR